MNILEAIANILKFGDDYSENIFVKELESIKAAEIIDELQFHENKNISLKVLEILDKFHCFGDKFSI